MSRLFTKDRKPYLIPAIYIVVKNTKNEVLFLERYNTGYCDGQLTLPSGHVEHTEDFLCAATRELYEETGLQAQVKDLQFVHMMKRNINSNTAYIDIYVKANSSIGLAYNAEPQKSSRIIWINADRNKENIIDHVSHAITLINKGILISSW